MMAEENRETLVTTVGTAIQEYQRGVDAIDAAVAARLGINRTDLRALGVLSGGPRPAGELAAQVGLSAAAMTTALDRLERKGLVRRSRAAADRRKVFVELTEEARLIRREAMGPVVEEGVQLLAPYSNDDLLKFAGFLRTVCESNQRHVNRIRALGKA
jgi:DNA-binding MarR family transcriptional regulator